MDGYEIETVEGLASDATLSRLQQAFLDHFSFQCGYCTPGFLMAATLLIERLEHSPIREDQIDDAIADACGQHICRWEPLETTATDNAFRFRGCSSCVTTTKRRSWPSFGAS